MIYFCEEIYSRLQDLSESNQAKKEKNQLCAKPCVLNHLVWYCFIEASLLLHKHIVTYPVKLVLAIVLSDHMLWVRITQAELIARFCAIALSDHGCESVLLKQNYCMVPWETRGTSQDSQEELNSCSIGWYPL